MSYSIEMARSAYRLYKKFDPPLQNRIKEEAQAIAKNPTSHKHLKAPFQNVRAYRFTFQGTAYRIAYDVDEEQQIVTILLVHPRENFYRLLRRALGY